MGLLMRTLLVWLLVLAVPAQGVAAATMAFCGSHHQGGTAATHAQQTAPSAHAHAQAHARAHAQGKHGDHAPATVSQAHSADVGGSAALATSAHADAQKCSACAACCSFGALLNSVLALAAPDLTPTVFSVVVPTVDAFAVDGPDRPPRIVLA